MAESLHEDYMLDEDELPILDDEGQPLPTKGNWYPEAIRGDEECENGRPENSVLRKVYGVSPCFGRIFKYELPEPVMPNYDWRDADFFGYDLPLHYGPHLKNFTQILVKWDVLNQDKFIYLSIDLDQTTDLFLQWYIYWATNQHPDDQILKFHKTGAHRYVTKNGSLLSAFKEFDDYRTLFLYQPYPEENHTLDLKFYMGPGPVWENHTVRLVNYKTTQVCDLRDVVARWLEEDITGSIVEDKDTFYFTMSPDPNTDIPKEHQYLEEVVDQVPGGVLYIYDKVSEQAMRADPSLIQPHRFPGWGFNMPINVRTPVTLMVPSLCDHTFEFNLQMAVKTVTDLRDFIAANWYRYLPENEYSNIRFSRYRDPNDLREPVMRTSGHTLSRAAYETHAVDADTLKQPITIYVHFDFSAEGIEEYPRLTRTTNLKVCYHESLAPNDYQIFNIPNCPLLFFVDNEWETDDRRWMELLRKFRELLHGKLFKWLGIKPCNPLRTAFTLGSNRFPEQCAPVTPFSLWLLNESDLTVHMWDATPAMLSVVDAYMERKRYVAARDIRPGPRGQGEIAVTFAINKFYELDPSIELGLVPPISSADQTRRDALRDLLNEPIVYNPTPAAHLRGGGLPDEEDSPALEDGDNNSAGFDLDDDAFEQWDARRRRGTWVIDPERQARLKDAYSPTLTRGDSSTLGFDLSEDEFVKWDRERQVRRVNQKEAAGDQNQWIQARLAKAKSKIEKLDQEKLRLKNIQQELVRQQTRERRQRIDRERLENEQKKLEEEPADRQRSENEQEDQQAARDLDDNPTIPGSAIVVRWVVLRQPAKHAMRVENLSATFRVADLKNWMWRVSKVHPSLQNLSFRDSNSGVETPIGPDDTIINLADGRDWLHVRLNWDQSQIRTENIKLDIRTGEKRGMNFIVPDIPTSITRLIWFIRYALLKYEPFVSQHPDGAKYLGYEIHYGAHKDTPSVLITEERLDFMRTENGYENVWVGLLDPDEKSEDVTYPTIYLTKDKHIAPVEEGAAKRERSGFEHDLRLRATKAAKTSGSQDVTESAATTPSKTGARPQSSVSRGTTVPDMTFGTGEGVMDSTLLEDPDLTLAPDVPFLEEPDMTFDTGVGRGVTSKPASDILPDLTFPDDLILPGASSSTQTTSPEGRKTRRPLLPSTPAGREVTSKPTSDLLDLTRFEDENRILGEEAPSVQTTAPTRRGVWPPPPPCRGVWPPPPPSTPAGRRVTSKEPVLDLTAEDDFIIPSKASSVQTTAPTRRGVWPPPPPAPTKQDPAPAPKTVHEKVYRPGFDRMGLLEKEGRLRPQTKLSSDTPATPAPVRKSSKRPGPWENPVETKTVPIKTPPAAGPKTPPTAFQSTKRPLPPLEADEMWSKFLTSQMHVQPRSYSKAVPGTSVVEKKTPLAPAPVSQFIKRPGPWEETETTTPDATFTGYVLPSSTPALAFTTPADQEAMKERIRAFKASRGEH